MNVNDTTHQKEFWSKKVPLELHGHKKKLQYFKNEIHSLVEKKNNSHARTEILEVGCSNGRNISFPLAELGYSVTGVDVHEPSINWASEHNNFSNAQFICEDFFDFSSKTLFDVIILSDILEHVHNPLEVLHASARLLKKDGNILICIPNGYGPYELEQRLIRLLRLNGFIEHLKVGLKIVLGKRKQKVREYNYESGHIQFFRMADILLLTERANLSLVKTSNGALFGGGLTYVLGILFPFIVKPSLQLADKLPSKMVTTWYFTFRKSNNKN